MAGSNYHQIHPLLINSVTKRVLKFLPYGAWTDVESVCRQWRQVALAQWEQLIELNISEVLDSRRQLFGMTIAEQNNFVRKFLEWLRKKCANPQRIDADNLLIYGETVEYIGKFSNIAHLSYNGPFLNEEVRFLLKRIGCQLESLSLNYLDRRNRDLEEKGDKKMLLFNFNTTAVRKLTNLKNLELKTDSYFSSEDIASALAQFPAPEQLESLVVFTRNKEGEPPENLPEILKIPHEANARLTKFASLAFGAHESPKTLDFLSLLPNSIFELCIPLSFQNEENQLMAANCVSEALASLENLRNLFLVGSSMSEKRTPSPLPEIIADNCPKLEKLGFRGAFRHSNQEFPPLLKLGELKSLHWVVSPSAKERANDKILEFLLAMPRLKSLDLNCLRPNQFTSADALDCKNLEELSLQMGPKDRLYCPSNAVQARVTCQYPISCSKIREKIFGNVQVVLHHNDSRIVFSHGEYSTQSKFVVSGNFLVAAWNHRLIWLLKNILIFLTLSLSLGNRNSG